MASRPLIGFFLASWAISSAYAWLSRPSRLPSVRRVSVGRPAAVSALDGTAAWLAAGGVDALHTTFSGIASGVGLGIGQVSALVHEGSTMASTSPEWLQHSPTLVAAESLEGSDAFDMAGRDLLIFLAATSAVVPACRALNISPVLGFLGAGVALGPEGAGMFADLGVDNKVGEVGILFLLFEQGLELSLKRLKALAKYAFGMGALQIIFCTLAFTLFPFLGGVDLLEYVFGSPGALVDIRRFDESFVVGASLALSSSAFVLKLLQESGQLTARIGSASLGVLLMQDIAVVPLLVLLPLIVQEQAAGSSDALTIASMAESTLVALGGLGLLAWAGRYVLRFVFEIVASARSSDTFVALCLLVVLGTSALTEALGLSSTLGAFLAGTLLAETNYRTTVEADIQPFRGLLLGLFFMTTGASVDLSVVAENLPTVVALLFGLVAFKAVIITALGRVFRLSWGECVRTGLLLSGGGEFAFVVLTLAERLAVIPDGLARLLTAIVVMSMALTPALAALGDYLANLIEGMGIDEWGQDYRLTDGATRGNLTGQPLAPPSSGEAEEYAAANAVVVCGFGPVGQTVASMLTAASVVGETETSWLAFDLDPNRVSEGRARGFPVFYGDASMPGVIEAAGVATPRAFVVTYSDVDSNFHAVELLRESHPGVPILSRAKSQRQLFKLFQTGAAEVVPEHTEVALRLGSLLLTQFGIPPADVAETSNLVRSALEQKALELGRAAEDEEAKSDEKALKSAARSATTGAAGGEVFTRRASSSPTAQQFDRNIVPVDLLRQAKASLAAGQGNALDAALEPVSVMAPVRRPEIFEDSPATGGGSGTAGVDYCLLPDGSSARVEESDLPDFLDLKKSKDN